MRSQQEIVAHLRKVALNMHRNTEPTENQAATLIEQQARRIAELEGALSACMPYMKYPRTEPAALVTVHKKAIERARAALASAAPLADRDAVLEEAAQICDAQANLESPAHAPFIRAVAREIRLRKHYAAPAAWSTPNDWGKEPLVTTDEKVASAWRADNRQVTALAAAAPVAAPVAWRMRTGHGTGWREVAPDAEIAHMWTPLYAAPVAAAAPGAVPMTLITQNGKPFAAYPRRKQAEVYASGFSDSAGIELVDGEFFRRQ